MTPSTSSPSLFPPLPSSPLTPIAAALTGSSGTQWFDGRLRGESDVLDREEEEALLKKKEKKIGVSDVIYTAWCEEEKTLATHKGLDVGSRSMVR